MDNLKIICPGKPEYMTMIRLATGSLAAQAGLDLDAVEDIKMAVFEACKNVSCHQRDGYSDKYEIEFCVGDGVIEVTVCDACDKHTLEKSKKCKLCPQEGDIGSIMIRSLVDCAEFGCNGEGHKFINMVKRI